jgi:broad specificity phosphatase PhoE
MKIVIVRHGETEYNKTRRIQGQQQIPLNKKGKAQAKQITESLMMCGFTHIYCSNLRRERETTDIINESFSLPIRTDSRLNERNFGVWENRYFDELLNEYTDLKVRTSWGSWDFTPNQGETVRDLVNRSIEFLKDVIKKHQESDIILIVTHGGPMRIMLGFIKSLDIKDYMDQGIDNGQILRVKYEGSKFTFE